MLHKYHSHQHFVNCGGSLFFNHLMIENSNGKSIALSINFGLLIYAQGAVNAPHACKLTGFKQYPT